jgi:hypothetical protein
MRACPGSECTRSLGTRRSRPGPPPRSRLLYAEQQACPHAAYGRERARRLRTSSHVRQTRRRSEALPKRCCRAQSRRSETPVMSPRLSNSLWQQATSSSVSRARARRTRDFSADMDRSSPGWPATALPGRAGLSSPAVGLASRERRVERATSAVDAEARRWRQPTTPGRSSPTTWTSETPRAARTLLALPRGRPPKPALGEVETVANAPPHAVVNDRAER